jgi:hypothetical protein
MSEMSDQERTRLAALHAAEQFGETLRTILAPMVANYYGDLARLGVPAEAATMLACGVQETMIALLTNPHTA